MVRRGLVALAIRATAGAIFVLFGIGKFVDHEAETASFAQYGLPRPEELVYVIGAIELGGGLLLILGLLTIGAAAVLACNMLAAIVLSGFGEGEAISLTLAPLLLVATLALLRTGPGDMALDARLRAYRRRRR